MSVERWHMYALQVVEGAHAAVALKLDNVIQIRDLPGPYYLRGVATSGASSGKEIKCRDGVGDYWQSNLVAADLLASDAVPLPIWPPLEYPFNSVFRFDLLEPVTEALQPFWLTLWGAHKLADPVEPSPYPADYRETPYTIQVTTTIAARGSQKLPVKVQFNTPFALRELTFDRAADAVSPGTILVLLRDEKGQAFYNTAIPVGMAFGSPGSPVTPSPEPIIPAGRAFTVELVEVDNQGPTTIQLNFGGALLSAV